MKKIHISLTDESYGAIRQLAFDTESSISAVIDMLIDEQLVNPEPKTQSYQPEERLQP